MSATNSSLSRSIIARGANLTLRLTSTAVRLVLALLVTRSLGIEVAGAFALFQTSTILLGQLIGLDLFWWYSREIASNVSTSRRGLVIASVRWVFARSYAVGALLALLPFIGGFVPWRYFAVFLAIAFFEQIAQELYRILIALGRPVAANTTFFIRSASWVPVFLLLVYALPGARSLTTLYACWLVGDIVALLTTVVLIEKSAPHTLFARPQEPLPVRESLRTSKLYFASSILTNVVEYSDRYLLAALAGTAEVGVFWILRGLSNVIVQASYFVVYEFRFPVVAAASAARTPESTGTARAMVRDGALLAVLAAVGVIACYSTVVRLIGRPELANYWPVLVTVAVGAILASLATGLTFMLNALRSDRGVLPATVMAAVTSVVGNIILIPLFGIHGAAVTFALSSGVRAALLAYAARSATRTITLSPGLSAVDERRLDHV